MASRIPDASSAITLEEMRERIVFWAQAAFAATGGLVCAGVVWQLLARAPETGARVVGALAGQILFLDKAAEALGVSAPEFLAPPILAFLAGGWLSWKARGLVRWGADRLFPSFDTDLLRPIRRAGTLDPLWLPPGLTAVCSPCPGSRRLPTACGGPCGTSWSTSCRKGRATAASTCSATPTRHSTGSAGSC
jgi:hypothetical protein